MEFKQNQIDVIQELKSVVARAHDALKDEYLSLKMIKDDVFYLLQKKLELIKEMEVIKATNENAKMQSQKIVQEGREEAEKVRRSAGEYLAQAVREREAAAKELEAAKKTNAYAQRESARVKQAAA